MQPKLRLEGVLAERTDDQTRLDGIAVDSLPKWLRDLIDINNEIADRDTGRVKRFLPSSGDHGPDSEKKKEERQFNALMRLLQDPGYARLYIQAATAISDAEDAAASAMKKLTREGEIAQERVEALRNAAAEFPDGRKVFLGEDGKLSAEDGSDVTDEKDSVRGLSANTARFKDYARAREIAEDIERRKREVEEYQRGEIDPAKRRLADPDNPPSKEELEDIMRRLKDRQPADIVRAREQREPDEAKKFSNTSVPANSAAADELVPAKGVDAPDLFAQFRAASAVVPDDAFSSPAPGASAKPV